MTTTDATTPRETYAALVWRQFRRRRGAMVGLFMTAILFLIAFLAPFLAHQLPIVWIDADGAVSFPLIREFFAPMFTTEGILERLYNYLLLFLPVAVLLLRLLPDWREYARPWIAIALGAALAVALGAGIVSLFMGLWPKDPEELFWKVVLVAAMGLSVAVLGGTIVLASAQGRASPRWLVILGAAGLVLIPFWLVQSRNDRTPYRTLAAAGEGRGWFPLVPYGPDEQGFGPKRSPSWYPHGLKKESHHKPGYHLFGTDEVGRDVLVRMIHGARVSLSVGFLSVFVATTIGLIVGAYAAYFGGLLDLLAMRLIEILICIPVFFLILTLIAFLDKRSILNIMLVLGLTGWTGVARLIRGEVLKQRQQDYVTAARALGTSATRIIFRHILPNAIAPVLVSVSFGIAGAILTEAGLSFLGFGVAPPTPTWGELLNQAREGPLVNWWLVIFPGLLLFAAVFAYNLVGEGLRDALDPRLRG